jgi:hypothetical protein
MPITYSYRLWCRAWCVLVSLLLGLASRSQAQVYYLTTDGSTSTAGPNDALYRMNFDGSGMTPLVTAVSTIGNYLALDPVNNRAFVTEGLATSPNRGIKVFSGVNGGSPTLLRTLPVTVAISALEYDAASDYIYFLTSDGVATTLTTTDALNRIKADGTGSVEVLVPNVANSPIYLALNTATNRAYVYEGLTASRGIKTIDLSNNTVIGTTIPVTAAASALDYDRTSGYLYYLTTDGAGATTSATDAIYRVIGNGTSTTSTAVITSVTGSPGFMALDLDNNRIYVADNFNTTRGFRIVTTTNGINGTVTATIPQGITFVAVEIGQPVPPTVSTNTPVTSIAATSATLGGNVTAAGTDPVTERGVVYSTTNTTPTTADTKAANGTGTGTFSQSITGLTPGTTYYVRAYATSDAGTSYGAPISFATLAATAPTVTTAAAGTITTTSAVLGGNVTADGGASVTERGVVYSTTNTPPTTADTKATNGSGTGTFSATITGLTAGTTYYVRAYATNSVGTSYGSVISFTTLAPPTVTTDAATAVATNSATLGGSVTADGGAAVTERGVVYVAGNGTPTTANTKVQIGTGTGAFSQSITGLTSRTLYSVRAYAINSAGTSYGAVQTFTTLNLAPVVTTTGGTTTFIIGGGPVAIDNGLTVTDADNTTLASAIVRITSGFQNGQDVLQFNNTNATTFGNIGTNATATGTLPLSSAGNTATVAQWQCRVAGRHVQQLERHCPDDGPHGGVCGQRRHHGQRGRNQKRRVWRPHHGGVGDAPDAFAHGHGPGALPSGVLAQRGRRHGQQLLGEHIELRHQRGFGEQCERRGHHLHRDGEHGLGQRQPAPGRGQRHRHHAHGVGLALHVGRSLHHH